MRCCRDWFAPIFNTRLFTGFGCQSLYKPEFYRLVMQALWNNKNFIADFFFFFSTRLWNNTQNLARDWKGELRRLIKCQTYAETRASGVTEEEHGSHPSRAPGGAIKRRAIISPLFFQGVHFSLLQHSRLRFRWNLQTTAAWRWQHLPELGCKATPLGRCSSARVTPSVID